MDPDRERRVVAAIDRTERTLWARGYTAAQAAAAVKTARKWAQGIAAQLSPEIKDQAFEELLNKRLATAANWLERTREGVAGG